MKMPPVPVQVVGGSSASFWRIVPHAPATVNWPFHFSSRDRSSRMLW